MVKNIVLHHYDATENKWEPLSLNPIRNDVLWVISNELGDIPCQTIFLYTNLMKNRPGKYRIRKLFNNDTLIVEAEFEMVDKPTEDGIQKNKISKRMHEFDSETDTVVNPIR